MLSLALAVAVHLPALVLCQPATAASALQQLLQSLSTSSAGTALSQTWLNASSEPCSSSAAPWAGLVCDAATSDVVGIRLRACGLTGNFLNYLSTAFPALVSL
jgi:hypothetical protein